MTRPLTLDRFRELADAYGGVIARWPEAGRDAAMQMASLPAARGILLQASVLDAVLDEWRVSAPTAEQRSRAALGAPVPSKSLVVRARLWWCGIGIAAAACGAVAGAAAVAVVAPINVSSDSTTSFGDVAAQET
jgi:hypothetical protein